MSDKLATVRLACSTRQITVRLASGIKFRFRVLSGTRRVAMANTWLSDGV